MRPSGGRLCEAWLLCRFDIWSFCLLETEKDGIGDGVCFVADDDGGRSQDDLTKHELLGQAKRARGRD